MAGEILGVNSVSDLRNVIKLVIIFALGQGTLSKQFSTNSAKCLADSSCKQDKKQIWRWIEIFNPSKKSNKNKPVILHFLHV